MKIIETDNFGRDYPDEKLIASGITDPRLGRLMVAGIQTTDPNDPRYYRLVDDDYKLQPGFTP